MKHYLLDMNGVLVQGKQMIPGADEFINKLIDQKRKFLLLTNNSLSTPNELAKRLHHIGLQIKEEQIFSSALATAAFLNKQRPKGKAFVLGESGLIQALEEIGYNLTDNDPDYVVLGETLSYDFEMTKKAIRLIHYKGARFIATNPDPAITDEGGLVPSCGAMAALIEKVTGVSPIFIGKPNPLMMRTALNYLDVQPEKTIMVGDTMGTDIAAGVTNGLETILVLSGVTKKEDIDKYPFLPTYTMNSVAEIEPMDLDN